jgi:hypothetical protein
MNSEPHNAPAVSDRTDAGRPPTSGRHQGAAWLIQPLVPALVAALFWWRGRTTMALVLAGIGAFLLLCGLFAPRLAAAIQRGGNRFGRWFSTGLTWALMTLLFYTVFLPGRLILLARRIDPMCRRVPTREPTYWVRMPPAPKADDYSRQF